MEENIIHEIQQTLYNTDLKSIEANLERFIQKKEQDMLEKRGSNNK